MAILFSYIEFSDISHLTDRYPLINLEGLILRLVPPSIFTNTNLDNYFPNIKEPSQKLALYQCRLFCKEVTTLQLRKKSLLNKRKILSGNGLYLKGNFGLGKTHLLAGVYFFITKSGFPVIFSKFDDIIQLVGLFGYYETVKILSSYAAICVDDFEFDDPGNTILITKMLPNLVSQGVSIATTSNILPKNLGKGRFASQDFLEEINILIKIFTLVEIKGLDSRLNSLTFIDESFSDNEVAQKAEKTNRATLDHFDVLLKHLSTMHPSRYNSLIEGINQICIIGAHTIKDQNTALRLVSFADKLYDSAIPVLISGTNITSIFSKEILIGAFRKKYLRAISRLVALKKLALDY